MTPYDNITNVPPPRNAHNDWHKRLIGQQITCVELSSDSIEIIMDFAAIKIRSQWTLRDADGFEVDCMCDIATRVRCELWRIAGQSVTSAVIGDEIYLGLSGSWSVTAEHHRNRDIDFEEWAR